MIYTTLDEIRRFGPCVPGWSRLLSYLGKTAADDEPLPLVTVLDSNGLRDTIWCLRVCPDIAAKFARWCADRTAEAAEAAYWAAYWADDVAEDTDWADDVAGWAADAADRASWAAARAAEHQADKLRELLS